VTRVFIFDLDDTLIPTQYDYTMSLIKLCEAIAHDDQLGYKIPDPFYVLKSFYDIDTIKIEREGFTLNRWKSSMIETYDKICKEVLGKHTNLTNIKNTVEGITYSCIKDSALRKEFLPNARQVLDFLKKKNDKLILLTSGSRDIQELKFESLNIRKWFGDNVFVAEGLKEKMFADIIDQHKGFNVWSVGNSFKSDILPALKLGAKGIYIPFEPRYWDTYNTKGIYEMPLNSSFITINNIVDIMNKYESL
jgi:putative hydrolase of the HAD superfamily